MAKTKRQQTIAFAAPETANDELSPIQLYALAAAIKPKAFEAARLLIPENSATTFSFDVRITGSLTRGAGTPSATGSIAPSVNLATPAVFFAVLNELGIGPKRLQEALEAVADSNKPQPQLCAVFDQVAAAKVKKLPRVTTFCPGRSGAINVQATVTKLPGTATQ
jgi:hypothetical protein